MRTSYAIKHDVFFASQEILNARKASNTIRILKESSLNYKAPVTFQHFFDCPRYVLLSELLLINTEIELRAFVSKACWISELILIDDVGAINNPTANVFKNYLVNQIITTLETEGISLKIGIFA